MKIILKNNDRNNLLEMAILMDDVGEIMGMKGYWNDLDRWNYEWCKKIKKIKHVFWPYKHT